MNNKKVTSIITIILALIAIVLGVIIYVNYDFFFSDSESLSLVIVEIDKNHFVIAADENSSNDLYSFVIKDEFYTDEFIAGSLILLKYSGGVQESYPMGFSNIISVKYIGPADESLIASAKEVYENFKKNF